MFTLRLPSRRRSRSLRAYLPLRLPPPSALGLILLPYYPLCFNSLFLSVLEALFDFLGFFLLVLSLYSVLPFYLIISSVLILFSFLYYSIYSIFLCSFVCARFYQLTSIPPAFIPLSFLFFFPCLIFLDFRPFLFFSFPLSAPSFMFLLCSFPW